MRFFGVFFLISLWAPLFAGNPDSLLYRLKQSLSDSEKAKTLIRLSDYYVENNPLFSSGYMKQAIKVYENNNDKKRTGKCYNSLAMGYTYSGNFDSSILYLKTGYALLNAEGDTLEVVYSLRNIGICYFFINNYNEALNFFFKALKLAQKINDANEISLCYGNIGNVYKEQGKPKDALSYYYKSREYATQVGDVSKIASTYINAGNVYYDMAKKNGANYLDSAHSLYLFSEKIMLRDPDSSILAMLYGNIGNVFAEKKQFIHAAELYHKMLDIKLRINDMAQIAVAYENLASCYLDMGDIGKVEKFILLGLKEAVATDSYEDMSSLYLDYSRFYHAKKNFEKAYDYHVLYKQFADSVLNSDNIEKRKELEMNFNFEKEREQNILEKHQKELLENEEKKRNRIYFGIMIAGLLIAIIIALIIFRNLKVMRRTHAIIIKQKNVIEKQKELVEEKQKEILDSIRYARRIQSSLLTSEKYIHKYLNKRND